MAAVRTHDSIEKSASPASLVSLSSMIRALRSGVTKRPSRAMHTGTMSTRSFVAAFATERADRIDTSCSALWPPKRRRVRMGMGGGVYEIVILNRRSRGREARPAEDGEDTLLRVKQLLIFFFFASA